jgi:hypothetical protein
MIPAYKTFRPAEFVDREVELERVQNLFRQKSRCVIIVEGERGSGKTSLLFELYHRIQERNELRPFLVSLFPYSAPDYESQKNIWMNSARSFQVQDIPELLDQLARFMEIDFIQSHDPDIQKEYFARGLAYRSPKTVPLLLVDASYECPEATRSLIEKYILAPILTSERIYIVLTGRGKRPVWSRPELQTAEIIELVPLTEVYVKEQLERIKSRHVGQFKEIANLSGGYPLIVRVMGESPTEPIDSLNQAIDIIIKDTLPREEREEAKYAEARSQIEKLSLVGIPFRIPDVEDYLYPDDHEQRLKTYKLVNLLLASHILRYEGQGYRLSQSLIHPIRSWLMRKQQPEYERNLMQLSRVSMRLQENYPSAKTWYQRMLPEGLISNNRVIPPNPVTTHNRA